MKYYGRLLTVGGGPLHSVQKVGAGPRFCRPPPVRMSYQNVI